MKPTSLLVAAALALSGSALAAPQGDAQPVPKEPTTPTAPEATAPSQPPTAPAAPLEPAPGQAISPISPIAPISPISPVSPGESAPIAPVETEHATRFVIPAEITGDSEGVGSARIGFGLLRGFGEATDPTAWDLAVVLGLEVSTQRGLARLVGLERADEVADEPVGSLSASVTLAQLDLESEGGSAFPPLQLYAGGKVGRAPFRYLGPGPEQRAETAEPTLELREDLEVPWGLGATAVFIPQGRRELVPSVEAQASFESRWIPSTRTASWCTPAGGVVRDGDPSAPTTTFDDAESCNKAALGAPTNTQEFSIAAHFGLIDRIMGASWRGAIGLRASIPVNEGAMEDFRLSVRAPFYLTLARAGSFEYRGILRLTPSLEVHRLESGKTDVGAVIELSLLGQRGLFADQLEDL